MVGWNDPIPCEIEKECNLLHSELQRVDQVQIDRSLTPSNHIGHPTLAIFLDGSPKAYGAVAYCRWKVKRGVYKSKIIAAKSRIAPLKVINITRLELCGAAVSKRLHEFVCKE